MKAHRWIPLLAAAWSLTSMPARAADPLDEVATTRRVCAAGPDTLLARAQRLRGSAAVRSASVLPNPAVVVEHNRTLTGAADRETIVGLSVPVGIGGRRFLLQDAAQARREQARADAHATVFESALVFREAYVAAIVDQAKVLVLTEQQAALDALSAMIQGLARGGEAAGYDLLRQQTQARIHRRRLNSQKARALASRSLLEAWTESEVVLPALEQAALVQRAPAAVPASGASETPRVRSLEAESRASAIEARAARRRWLPDLDVFAGYRGVSTGSETGHGIALGLTLPLTFFDHGQGEAARAEAEQQVARAAAQRLRQQHKAQVKAARLALEQLQAGLADAEAASAEAVAIQAKAGQLYSAGEATITELLEAFRGAEEAKLAKLELAEEMAVARLSLMRASGTMFDGALDRECSGGQGGAP